MTGQKPKLRYATVALVALGVAALVLVRMWLFASGDSKLRIWIVLAIVLLYSWFAVAVLRRMRRSQRNGVYEQRAVQESEIPREKAKILLRLLWQLALLLLGTWLVMSKSPTMWFVTQSSVLVKALIVALCSIVTIWRIVSTRRAISVLSQPERSDARKTME
jgi:ABC-type protease/lipase transport system fused ATPase/permease subunit